MRPSDRGSASIWLLGIASAVLAFAALVAVSAGLLVARHRARAAVDLAALAGATQAARGEPAACEQAAAVARAQQAMVVACDLEGLDLVLTVEVGGPIGLRGVRTSARAGPRLRAEYQR